MLTDCYQVEASPDLLKFEFISIGPKGAIEKVVRYTEMKSNGFFNLGFGDKDPVTGYISDLAVTDNNDSQKVLTTVASTLYAFTNYFLNATIFVTGSTEARTRLYRIGITNHLADIEKDFIVLGLTGTEWEPFRKNIYYIAFLVRRKT